MESLEQKMEKKNPKDIEHRVGKVKGNMVYMEEHMIKGHNYYKIVMMEIAEVKGKIGIRFGVLQGGSSKGSATAKCSK